jgi:Reverse transcriptase (RNA-dependent DNA polymerase)
MLEGSKCHSGPQSPPTEAIQSDLRPISLTPTLGKILESFIGSWILERIEHQLDSRQYGALRGRSTTHALVDALHHWHSAVDSRQSVRTVFVDYAKAFDHVDHNILVAKMVEFGLSDVIIRWICSFLTDRRQRVKIGDVFSGWQLVNAGMAQGSYLGPLTFIILIDSLKSACLTHKFVDDTTLSEILEKGAPSKMQHSIDELLVWSTQHAMNVNERKTKEMIIGPIINQPPTPLTLDGATIDRVKTFKFLGVLVSDDLKWSHHIEAICSKAASRLHFLKLLARSGARKEDLVYFYSSIVRPILEYACPVWHSSLTVAQSDALEAIQKRAMRIVFQSMDYVTACILANIDALSARREQLTMKFFNRCVLNPDSCIHYLLPEKRAPEIINKLRKSSQFEISQSRTVKFSKSFIPYCLSNYQ